MTITASEGESELGGFIPEDLVLGTMAKSQALTKARNMSQDQWTTMVFGCMGKATRANADIKESIVSGGAIFMLLRRSFYILLGTMVGFVLSLEYSSWTVLPDCSQTTL